MGQKPLNVNAKAVVFAAWLRHQMAQNHLSQRALGKAICPGNGETGRRIVVRHLSGEHFPNAASRADYVEAFNLDGDPFTDEDEDDSQQAVARELRDIAARVNRLQRRVRA